jgi:hypothetical protein
LRSGSRQGEDRLGSLSVLQESPADRETVAANKHEVICRRKNVVISWRWHQFSYFLFSWGFRGKANRIPG